METSREKIISLELQDPEKGDTPNASLQLLPQDQMLTNITTTLQQQQQGEKGYPKQHELPQPMPQVRKTIVETLEKVHITKSYDEDVPVNQQTPHNVGIKDAEVVCLPEEAVDNDDEVYEEGEEEGEEEEEETDTASIVTVQANTEKLFLRTDDDELPSIELDSLSSAGMFGPSSLDSVASSTTKVTIKPTTITMRQTLAKEVVLPSTIQTTKITTMSSTNNGTYADEPNAGELATTTRTSSTTTTTHSIVQVVNPLISGEGQVQSIAISRSQQSVYPSFDKDDYEEQEDEDVDGQHSLQVGDFLPISQIVRSETFVMPQTSASSNATSSLAVRKPELSLNAKMKTVLEELLENERVKYNLQKSLEEEEEKDTNDAYTDEEDDSDDNTNYHYCRQQDVVDFGARATQSAGDGNGNQSLVNELIRDSNRNTLRKLQEKLKTEGDESDDDDDAGDDYDDAEAAEEEGDNDDDEEEDEEEETDDSDTESSDSDDEDDDDDDNETIHISFVDGAQVIENLNTNTPMKLQKSQTYNTMQEAEQAMTQTPEQEQPVEETTDSSQDDSLMTLEKLVAEQKKYAEITKQLRKSVENLLIDDNDDERQDDKNIQQTTIVTSTGSGSYPCTTTNQPLEQQHVVVTTTVSAATPRTTSKTTTATTHDVSQESGEEIFNRLLSAGGGHKQIFDQLTDETLTSSTTTCTEDNGTIVTTTTTISNIVTSGIPRVTKTTQKVVKSQGNSSNKQSTNGGQHRKETKTKSEADDNAADEKDSNNAATSTHAEQA